jgi:A/G-specific adenine glycosylase
MTGASQAGGLRAPLQVPDGAFVRRLRAWYRRHRRDLPWRKDADPYKIWVSEIMLQQTTVPAVVPYFERWLALFPNLASVAAAPLAKVLWAWQGLGYYSRARNLHKAARLLVRDYGGRIPDDEAAIRRLPGFGPYTTAAVLSLAHGRPFPVLDANVRRVFMRIFGVAGPGSAACDRTLLRRIAAFFPRRSPGAFNQAMMELGALVCRPRNPLCLRCPARAYCRAEHEDKQDVIPAPRRRVAEEIEAAVAVVERGGLYLIQKRPPSGLLAGLWEFPGGKVEPGEKPAQAARRELLEEVGIRPEGLRFLTTVSHSYTRFKVRLHVFLCGAGRQEVPRRADRRWVSLAAIRRYPLPSASVRIVELLAARAARGGPA